MLIAILLVEWFTLAWTGRLIKKRPIKEGLTPREFYWEIVRAMAWRILIFAIIPLPEIAFIAGIFTMSGEAAAKLTATAIMIPLILYPLFIGSVMWRARKLVAQKFDPQLEFLPPIA